MEVINLLQQIQYHNLITIQFQTVSLLLVWIHVSSGQMILVFHAQHLYSTWHFHPQNIPKIYLKIPITYYPLLLQHTNTGSPSKNQHETPVWYLSGWHERHRWKPSWASVSWTASWTSHNGSHQLPSPRAVFLVQWWKFWHHHQPQAPLSPVPSFPSFWLVQSLPS